MNSAILLLGGFLIAFLSIILYVNREKDSSKEAN